MNKKTGKVIRVMVVIVFAAALLLLGYYKLSRRDVQNEETVDLPATELERLKQKDLETSYPGTPTEVVKLYWRLNKCIYNDSLEEEDLDLLLEKLRMLYDEELLADSENTWDSMKKRLQEEIASFAEEERTISSYSVAKNSEVEYGEVEERECATVYCSILQSAKSRNSMLYEEFMCRKDADGKWKILGWRQTEERDE